MAGKLHLTYPPNIAKVKVMRRRTNVLGQGLWHIPFLFLYFFALRACVETSGNPYEVALAHHKSKGYDPDALAKATAPAKPAVVDDWGGAAATAEDDRWGDLEADPEELHDLTGDPGHAETLRDMEVVLRARLDPEEMDAAAKAAQAALIERHGGPEKAKNVGAPGTTPVPGYGQE